MTVITALLAALTMVMIGARLRPTALPRDATNTPITVTVTLGRRSVAYRRGGLLVAITITLGLFGPLAAGAFATAIVVHPRLRQIRASKCRTAAIAIAFPDLVDLLVLTIAAGHTPTMSIGVLGPVAPAVTRDALAHLERRMLIGDRFADAISGLQSPPPEGLGSIAQPLADALALADRYGTPLAPVLDRLAGQARGQRRRSTEIAARQLPIRLAFPLVGCTLPSFVLLTVVPLMAGTFSSLRGLTA